MQTRYFLCLFLIFIACCCRLIAQQGKKKQFSFRDSLDQAFDMSDFIINANGFVPVPVIITEPALGGFGVAIAPIFLKRNKPFIDSVNGKIQLTPVAPNITGGALMYTVNDSWLVGAGRSGTFVKSRIKYRVMAAYGSINMSFYKTISSLGEKEFRFNFKVLPFSLQAIKKIGTSNWYAGINYLFLKTDLKSMSDSLPDFVKDTEISSIVSQAGITIEFDHRDNVFTPDNGIKFHVDANRSDNILGSDYEYWRFNYYANLYRKILPSLTGGLRIDGQQVLDDPPFYLLPYIDMRGVPSARYQGNADLLSELELRWDFIKRWSILLFGGAGKAFDYWKDFGSSKWVLSGGSGFRYLLGRKFKLRVGIDVAKGPTTWAYYIVFGNKWLK